MSARIDFHCDILGKLPLELIYLVAGHLDLSDFIVLQRVSRRWKKILSIPSIQIPAVRAALGTRVNETNVTKLMKKRVRLERMAPIFKKEIMLPHSQNFPYPGSLKYANGKLAWISSSDPSQIHVFDIRSSKTVHFSTENRLEVSRFFLSDSLVISISHTGACNVWNLSTHEQKAFRLPSLDFSYAKATGTNIIFYNHPASGRKLLHWEWSSGIVRDKHFESFTFVAPCFAKNQLDIIRVEEESIYSANQKGAPKMTFYLEFERYVICETSGDFQRILSRRSQKHPMSFSIEDRNMGLEDLTGGFAELSNDTKTFDINLLSSRKEDEYLVKLISEDANNATLHTSGPDCRYMGLGIFYKLEPSGRDERTIYIFRPGDDAKKNNREKSSPKNKLRFQWGQGCWMFGDENILGIFNEKRGLIYVFAFSEDW